LGSPKKVMIFCGVGVACATKNHYMNTTTHIGLALLDLEYIAILNQV
jgi:hypothetical protein